MQLRYEDDFVEGAVFVRANSRRHRPPSLQVRRFHSAREKLYSILDPDERNAAFFQLHVEWFREWQLEGQLMEWAGEFPRLLALSALVFRKTRAKNDEGAELYVQSGTGVSPVPLYSAGGAGVTPARQTAVVALRVERFDQPEELAKFLRHEFTHVDDMINPAFEYSPELDLPGRNAAQQRVARERYRLLWDLTIDGRLGDDSVRDHHRAAFDRAFGFWPQGKCDAVFESLWRNASPRHADLAAIASDPRELQATHEPLPGAPCPLCGFATFQWARASDFDGPTAAAMQREFPHWTPEQRACGRCVQIYRVVSQQVGAAA